MSFFPQLHNAPERSDLPRGELHSFLWGTP